ncbi:MAG TPA: NADAR family protein [Actinophytocola sp.]|uniref:NADAR family protein n=1 Tax=Actinophytocola sp. TaxID=1872138 RepID=UPI002DBFD263|nr:NADAR family protein [Actinophytocola sp.]HEU5469956.1 NADAR family protein [Actinophytocola sp.]
MLRAVAGSPRSVAELVSRLGRGERIKFLFFWGHQPERDGRVGKGCLSQWWPAPFVVDGVNFRTAEHFMMWRKAKLFGDEASAAEVVRASHPRQAKELGRGVRGFDQQRWAECRFEIVHMGHRVDRG